jgi:hypothetical protein
VNEPLAADVIAKHRAMTRRYMIAKDLVPYLGIKSFAIMEKQRPRIRSVR